MQIFNVDETEIPVVHKARKEILGRKNVWSVTSGEKRENTHNNKLCFCLRFPLLCNCSCYETGDHKMRQFY